MAGLAVEEEAVEEETLDWEAQEGMDSPVAEEARARMTRERAQKELADQEQADLLGMQMPASLLLVEQLTFLESGQVVEYGRMFFRGDRYRVQIK